MHARATVIGGFCLSVLAGYAFLSAQRSNPAIASRLTQLDCTFSSSASGTWNQTGAHAQLQKASVLEFRLDHIDAQRGSANFALGALTAPMLMTVNDQVLHFIEPPADGETAITSVDMTGPAQRFPASYSRTMFYAYSGPGFTSSPQAEHTTGLRADAEVVRLFGRTTTV